MKIGDRIKNMFNADDEYFEEDEMEEEETESYEPVRPRSERHYRPKEEYRGERRQYAEPQSSGQHYSSSRVVDIHTTAKLQVVLKMPEHFDDATSIADELLEKRTVVINLEKTSKEEQGKLLSFLSGVAYANGGKLKKIANGTFIITPYNVDVMGDLLDELENNGMFFI